MIEKSQRETGRDYACGDCPTVNTFTSIDCARAAGWCVSQDRKKCYCPVHAPLHRHVGRGGQRKQFPPPGWEQIKIENLG